MTIGILEMATPQVILIQSSFIETQKTMFGFASDIGISCRGQKWSFEDGSAKIVTLS